MQIDLKGYLTQTGQYSGELTANGASELPACRYLSELICGMSA